MRTDAEFSVLRETDDDRALVDDADDILREGRVRVVHRERGVVKEVDLVVPEDVEVGGRRRRAYFF